MRLRDWDVECASLHTELQELHQAVVPTAKTSGSQNVYGLRDSLAAHQMAISQLIHKIKKLSKLDMILLPRERTLLHWAGLFAEKMRRTDELRGRYMTRMMWLQLIHARLVGEASSDGKIEPDELVKLAIREADLEKTERHLADALVRYRQEKQDLHERYRTLGLQEANWEAARTMNSRLGRTPEDAFASPTHRALSRFVKKLVAPVRAKGALKQLRTLQSQYDEKTKTILGDCQTVMLDRLRGVEKELSEDKVAEFQSTLRQLNTLDRETRKAYLKLFPEAPERVVSRTVGPT